MSLIKTPAEIAGIKEAGKIVSKTLALMEAMAVPGTNLLDMSATADRTIRHLGGLPSCQGYHGFPAPICISVNEEVLHGIPKDYKLKDGDLVSFDLVVNVNNLHADSARTVQVGRKTEEGTLLIAAADEALLAALREVKDGTYVMVLSAAIWSVAKKYGFTPAKDVGGHGIGNQMHEPPFIANNPLEVSGIFQLRKGMVIAVEPTMCAGTGNIVLGADKWTLSTMDGMLSSHSEHTVVVTETGYEKVT